VVRLDTVVGKVTVRNGSIVAVHWKAQIGQQRSFVKDQMWTFIPPDMQDSPLVEP